MLQATISFNCDLSVCGVVRLQPQSRPPQLSSRGHLRVQSKAIVSIKCLSKCCSEIEIRLVSSTRAQANSKLSEVVSSSTTSTTTLLLLLPPWYKSGAIDLWKSTTRIGKQPLNYIPSQPKWQAFRHQTWWAPNGPRIVCNYALLVTYLLARFCLHDQLLVTCKMYSLATL